jgi:hypothetical protein
MLRIVKSFLTIAVVAAIAVGATGAYFTGQTTVEDMNFSTGTLEITDTSDTWMQTVTFPNMKPGDSIRKWVVVTNTGSLDIGTLTVTATNVIGDADLLPNLKVSAMGDLPGGDDAAYFTDDWGSGSYISPWMNAADMLDVAYYRTPAGTIPVGSTYTMIFDISVPTTVGDDMQGKSVTFDMVFDAGQVI